MRIKEPDNTCPLIDKILRELQDLLKHKVVREHSDIENSLEWIWHLLDKDLRRANSDLRDWGHQWKDVAEELERINSELEEVGNER